MMLGAIRNTDEGGPFEGLWYREDSASMWVDHELRTTFDLSEAEAVARDLDNSSGDLVIVAERSPLY